MSTIEPEEGTPAEKNASNDDKSPLFNSTIATSNALKSLDDGTLINYIKASIPQKVVQYHASNDTFRRVLLPLILKLKEKMGAEMVDRMVGREVKEIRNSYQRKKNCGPPLESLLQNKSPFVVLLAIIARGDPFIELLLDGNDGWVDLGKNVHKDHQRRNKTVLMTFAGLNLSTSQKSQKRKYFEERFLKSEKKAKKAIAAGKEVPKEVSWIAFFSEELITILGSTYPDLIPFIEKSVAELKNGLEAGGGRGGGAAGLPSPSAQNTSVIKDLSILVNRKQVDPSVISPLIPQCPFLTVRLKAKVSTPTMPNSNTKSILIPYCSSQSLNIFKSGDPHRTLEIAHTMSKEGEGASDGKVPAKAYAWTTFYINSIQDTCRSVTEGYNTLLAQNDLNKHSNGAITDKTLVEYSRTASDVLAFLMATEEKGGPLDCLPDELPTNDARVLPIYLHEVHKAFLQLSVDDRVGCSGERMSEMLQCLFLRWNKAENAFEPVSAIVIGTFSTRLIYLFKQVWRFEKVLQAQPSGHNGQEEVMTRADRLVQRGAMYKAESMITVFKLKTASYNYNKGNFTRDFVTIVDDEQGGTQFWAGGKCINGENWSRAIEYLSADLISRAKAIFTVDFVALFKGKIDDDVLKKELPSDFECSGGHYFEELIRLLDGFYVLDVTDGSKNKQGVASFQFFGAGGGEGGERGGGGGGGGGNLITSNNLADSLEEKLRKVKDSDLKRKYLNLYCEFTEDLHALFALLGPSRAGQELPTLTMLEGARSRDSSIFYLKNNLAVFRRAKVKYSPGFQDGHSISHPTTTVLMLVSNALRKGVSKALWEDHKCSCVVQNEGFKSLVFVSKYGDQMAEPNRVFDKVLEKVATSLNKVKDASQPHMTQIGIKELRKIWARLEMDVARNSLNNTASSVEAEKVIAALSTLVFSHSHHTATHMYTVDYNSAKAGLTGPEMEALRALFEGMWKYLNIPNMYGGRNSPTGGKVEREKFNSIGEAIGGWRSDCVSALEGKELTASNWSARRSQISEFVQKECTWMLKFFVSGRSSGAEADDVVMSPEILKVIVEELLSRVVVEENLEESGWKHVHRNTLLLLPPGFGKTAFVGVIGLFLKHYISKRKFQVIIVPSVSAASGLSEELVAGGLKVSECWSGDGEKRVKDGIEASQAVLQQDCDVLVLVTDTAMKPTFQEFLFTCICNRFVNTIVLEEAHLYAEQFSLRLTAFSALREWLKTPILQKKVGVVVVTGSAPPAVEGWLLKSFLGLGEGTDIVGSNTGEGTDIVGSNTGTRVDGSLPVLRSAILGPIVSAPYIQFDLGGGKIFDEKNAAMEAMAKNIADSLHSKSPVLVAVLRKDDVEEILECVRNVLTVGSGSESAQVPHIFYHSDCSSSEKQMFTNWVKNKVGGEGGLPLLAFATQPCTGFSPSNLKNVHVFGSYSSITGMQALCRAARKWRQGQTGVGTFWCWKGMIQFWQDEGECNVQWKPNIHALKMKSYIQCCNYVANGQCARLAFSATLPKVNEVRSFGDALVIVNFPF